MKILMVSGNPRTETYGGVERQGINLSRFLSKYKELKIYLLNYSDKTQRMQKQNYIIHNIKRITAPWIFSPMVILCDIFRIYRYIKKINPDIIHLQGTDPWYSLLGAIVSRKYPTVITVHGFINEEYKFHVGMKRTINKFIAAPIEKFALSSIQNIIVLCPQIKEMIEKFSTSKIFIVPIGIDVAYVQKFLKKRKYSQQTILYLGLLLERKGIDTLIDAIPLVKKRVKNIKLMIAGKGPAEEKLIKKVKSNDIENHVTFLGYVEEKQKFLYMNSTDVFILPSYWESFPAVILEAMACGAPVIASNVAGIPYAVSDGVNGFLFEPGNINQLSEKILKILLNKKLLKKMREDTKIQVKKFDWPNIAKETRNVYYTILKEYVK